MDFGAVTVKKVNGLWLTIPLPVAGLLTEELSGGCLRAASYILYMAYLQGSTCLWYSYVIRQEGGHIYEGIKANKRRKGTRDL